MTRLSAFAAFLSLTLVSACASTSGSGLTLDPPASEIAFGDDSSIFANDDECDDPRFSGEGMAVSPDRTHAGADATDCRSAYVEGLIVYTGELQPQFAGVYDSIDFGNNDSTFASDGDCDDPRFSGESATQLGREHVKTDADDCKRLYEAGRVVYDGELPEPFEGRFRGVNFGDNSGWAAYDEECDDRRFRGFGMARAPYSADMEAADADDCKVLFEKGFIRFVGDQMNFTGRFRGIDFGDNLGGVARDGECDDPRFEGPGMAGALDPADEKRDAFDCKTAFEEGSIILRSN